MPALPRRNRCVQIALVLLLLLLAAALVSCGGDSPDATGTNGASSNTSGDPAGDPEELMVSAASSLKNAFDEIGAAFDAAHNAKTTFNYDSSGALQKQIEGGAPVDVFAAASRSQVDDLLAKGLVDESSVADFAGNEIVVAVPAGSKLAITGVEDLTGPEIKRVAYGDPKSAPHGVYAEEIMTTLGVMDQVRPKVIYTKNAGQTLTYVASGEVDAGLMFSTDAVAGGDDVLVAATAQPDWHGPILYPIAVVSTSKVKGIAQAFVDFVLGPEGREILQKHGFVLITQD